MANKALDYYSGLSRDWAVCSLEMVRQIYGGMAVGELPGTAAYYRRISSIAGILANIISDDGTSGLTLENITIACGRSGIALSPANLQSYLTEIQRQALKIIVSQK